MSDIKKTSAVRALAKIKLLKKSLACLCQNEFTAFCDIALDNIKQHVINHQPRAAFDDLQLLIIELEKLDMKDGSFFLLFNAVLEQLETCLLPDTVFFSLEGDFLNEEDDTHNIEVDEIAARVIAASKNPAKTLSNALEQCGWNVPTLEDVVTALETLQVQS